MRVRNESCRTLIKALTGDNVSNSFVICAVEHYSKHILADKSDWGNSQINQDLWRVIARDNLRIIDEYTNT